MADRGLFVVIEGGDASGKKTQAEKLVNRLQEQRYRVKYADFPAYDSEFGELVAKYLRGEYGEKEEIPVEIRSLLYSLDRYQFKKEYETFLENGGILIANRYSQSNYAYQSVGMDGAERKALVEWMKAVDARLPQPDRVFFLNLPPYVARNFMQQKRLRDYLHGEQLDIHEEDIAFQKSVVDAYLQLAEQDHWTRIECIQNNRLRTIEEIHKELFAQIKPLLEEKELATRDEQWPDS